jgi:uroporphyrinogen-III synthase
MPDRRYTILSTSTLPLEQIGIIPDSIEIRVLPFTEILAKNDEKIRLQIRQLAEEKITAAFTSAHAVRIVADQIHRRPDWKIYCTSNETRTAAINAFGKNHIAGFAANAHDLSSLMIEDRVQEATFFCGDQRLDTLPFKLKNCGITLHEIVVYETRLSPQSVEGPIDAILFFSPTAVKSFFSMNRLSAGTMAFVIGTTTAEALKKFTGSSFAISSEPDKEAVLKMAMEYITSHPIAS